MKNIEIRSGENKLESSKCPKCGGCGKVKVLVHNDYTRMVYGQNYDIPTEYWEDCPDCKSTRADDSIDRTGVPTQYRDADLSKFKWTVYNDDSKARQVHKIVSNFFQNFESWQKEGKGLYLWSTQSGSGKTFLACCLAKSVMIRYDIVMRFISVPEYFAMLKEQMDDHSSYDKTRIYSTCDLLVLDDVGTVPNKDWYESELFKLIDKRANEGLVTIFTSNINLIDLKNNDRLIDRINKVSFPIHFMEQGIRREQANEQNAAFMERMGMT